MFAQSAQCPQCWSTRTIPGGHFVLTWPASTRASFYGVSDHNKAARHCFKVLPWRLQNLFNQYKRQCDGWEPFENVNESFWTKFLAAFGWDANHTLIAWGGKQNTHIWIPCMYELFLYHVYLSFGTHFWGNKQLSLSRIWEMYNVDFGRPNMVGCHPIWGDRHLISQERTGPFSGPALTTAVPHCTQHYLRWSYISFKQQLTLVLCSQWNGWVYIWLSCASLTLGGAVDMRGEGRRESSQLRFLPRHVLALLHRG